jgi:hypothetical protein
MMNVVTLNVVTLNVVTLNVVTLNVITLNVFTLTVVVLSVIILSVVAPFEISLTTILRLKFSKFLNVSILPLISMDISFYRLIWTSNFNDKLWTPM